MKKKLPKIIKIFLAPIIIAILTISIIGIYRGGILLFGDTDLTYHFAKSFFGFDKIYVWNDYFQSGNFDLLKFQAFYLKKAIMMLNMSIDNLSIFSYLWYFLPIFGFALTFYFFVKTIVRKYLPNDDRNWLIPLTIAIASFMNGIFMLYSGQVLFVIGLIFANLFLILLFKNLGYIEANNKNNLLYVLLSGLVVSESMIYLQIGILIAYSLILLAIFNFRYIRKYYKQFLFWGGSIGLVVLLLNAQWLFVLMFQMLHKSGGVSELSVYNPNLGWTIAKGISSNIFFYELLRLKSYHIYNSSSALVLLFGYAPILLILGYLPRLNRDKLIRNSIILIMAALYFGYGVKAINEYPLYFMWNYFPFFSTFRTLMKFHFVYLYAFMTILAVVLTSIKNYKLLYAYLVLILMFSLTSLFYYYQADFRRNMEMYKIPSYYSEIQKRNFDLNDPKIGDAMLLPQTNWQYQYEWAPKKVDSMNIFPFFYGKGNLINGAQYEPDASFAYNDEFNVLMRTGDRTMINAYIATKNIKTIVYQNDARIPDDETLPANLKNRPPLDKKISFDEAKKILNNEVCETSESIGEIYFCRVYNTVFMPILSLADNNSKATIEYKKINPTKYNLVVHNLNSNETLHFAQNYHADWAVYQGIKPDGELSLDLKQHSQLQGETLDQATKDEAKTYLDQGLLSSTSSNGVVQFISKRIRGTIQNDNLPSGNFRQNWYNKPIISDTEHIKITNGQNGWRINAQDICSQNNVCVRNDDGSVDAYLSIELRSQKFLYLGLIVSITSFMLLMSVVVYYLIRKSKDNK